LNQCECEKRCQMHFPNTTKASCIQLWEPSQVAVSQLSAPLEIPMFFKTSLNFQQLPNASSILSHHHPLTVKRFRLNMVVSETYVLNSNPRHNLNSNAERGLKHKRLPRSIHVLFLRVLSLMMSWRTSTLLPSRLSGPLNYSYVFQNSFQYNEHRNKCKIFKHTIGISFANLPLQNESVQYTVVPYNAGRFVYPLRRTQNSIN